MAPTVLVVDDHAEFRLAARELLDDGGWEVVGEARDATGALEAAELLQPDLVLLDVGLDPDDPVGDGIDVAHVLAALPAAPSVVLVSARSAKAYGARLESAPVIGFIPKLELSGQILSALLGRD